MTQQNPPFTTAVDSQLTTRDFLPLLAYVVPTMVMAYGVVMPRHGITGLNELTVGFASAVLGATAAYILGLRAALVRRSAQPHRRWRRPTWIATLSAHPRGVAGWMLGHIMRRETAPANEFAVRLAALTPDACVLDVGCGAGHAVARVGRELVTGRVVGLDRSPTMVAHATTSNRALIAAGRAEVIAATADHVPFPDHSFDRVIAVHAVYFWPDLARVILELRRVLKPTGLLIIGIGDPVVMADTFPSSVYAIRSAQHIRDALGIAGFAEVAVAPSHVGGHAMWWIVAGPDAEHHLEHTRKPLAGGVSVERVPRPDVLHEE